MLIEKLDNVFYSDKRHDKNSHTVFDGLASEYNARFDWEGKLIFDTGIKAFQKILPSLPGPWLEMGDVSGRFAQALGIDTGIEPAVKLVEMTRSRGEINNNERKLF